MIILYQYLLVFLGAAIPWLEVLIVVPLGIVWGLSPVIVMIVGFLGNIITVIPVIFMLDKIRKWYIRRREKQGKTSKRSTRAVEIFKKYGVIGSALLGPLLTGTHIAAFIGMSMGASKKRMMKWMSISIASWVALVGILTSLGFDLFVQQLFC